MTKILPHDCVFIFIIFMHSTGIITPVYSQIPQQQVQLPEVLRRLSLPYHICTRTVENLWECVSSTSINQNSNTDSVETVTRTPDPTDRYNEQETDVPKIDHSITGDPTITTEYDTTTSTPTSSIVTSCPPGTMTISTNVDETMVNFGDDIKPEIAGPGSSEMSTDNLNTSGEEEMNPNVTETLIFEDDFQTFDLETWSHDITMSGGGNWEFQMYVNNRSNSYVNNGMLHIKPTLTADTYGEEFLSNGLVNLHGGNPADQCTNAWAGGCERRGNVTNILNPIMSAKIQTSYSFAFKYGRVEIRAKLPTGDWLRPGISLLPFRYNYGRWPASGEIHIVESRGNKELESTEGESIGVNQVSSSLDFGPFFPLNGRDKAQFKSSPMNSVGFDENFHIYELEWTADFIRFIIDGNETGKIEPSQQGFWDVGQFENIYSNPWKYSENIKMAPFDQKFYLSIHLAVGGTTGYFPDDSAGPNIKPWSDLSSTAYKEFWSGRSMWLPTWENASFIIDYVRVFSS